MRRALVVGIDYYQHVGGLFGCVNDSYSIKNMLERHADGSVNFDVRHLTGTNSDEPCSRSELRQAIGDLFAEEGEVAVLYFAGHGYIDATGGYLCSSEVISGDDGIALSDVVLWANTSRINNRIIILDSCYSGVAGGRPLQQQVAEISNGVTILTASTAEQYANEQNGAGVFTNLVVDALRGAAGNLVGDVTPGSLYAHVDQSLGEWGQRPVFKTNVNRFISLRRVHPPLEQGDLRRLSELFPSPGFQFPLDPTYEPERQHSEARSLPSPDPTNTAIFATLQRYNRVGLVVPEDAPHMWHAAMESKTVRLTALGEHYRLLAERGLI